MKNLAFLVIVLFGCNASAPEENATGISDSTRNNTPSLGVDTISIQRAPISKNQKDKAGRKQGVWDVYERGVLSGFETYKNDTLDGLYKAWVGSPAQVISGQYVSGRKDGLWKTFHNDTSLVGVDAYKSGTMTWSGFPAADSPFHAPVKGFRIYSDSILVQCPYANDVTWYEGLFVHKQPVGIHKMYYPNGKLKFEYNYTTQKVKLYDRNGSFQREVPSKSAYDHYPH